MKNLIKIFIVPLMLLFACSENDEVMKSFQDFEPEVFGDLTTGIIESVETPYESLMAAGSTGGRTTEEISATDLMESILTGARVIDVSLSEHRGMPVIEIELKMSGGGILEVYVLTDLSRIVEMEGVRGPFDYEIDPMGSFITLSEALSAAQSEVNGDMIRWELELEEENLWEYEIHILQSNGEIFEVEVNAFSGEIIAVKRFDNDDKEKYDDYFKGGGDDKVPTDLISTALSILNGTVIYTDSDDDDYEIYIETNSGAIVEFYFEDGQLEEMEGEKGPFDYNFTIDGLISFSDALNIALNEVDGTLVEWDLDLDDDQYFEFHIEQNGSEYEVEVDAKNGNVLDVEKDDDDDDDDWDDDYDDDGE